MAKIYINCPKCHTRFKVDEVHIGKKGQCKKCGERFVIRLEGTKNLKSEKIKKVEAIRPAQRAKPTQQVEATIKQTEATQPSETIPVPKAPRVDNDIAATIATPVEKNAEEIKQAEQDISAEWEEGQTILDLYEVKHVHRTGGMGLVYRVHHKNWNMDLAVKSPRSDYFKTEAQKENFINECEAWINLGLHPNIVSCYYVRNLGGIPRVFAEYVEGGSLKDWIENEKLYEGSKEKTLERILDIAIQFAWGLQYAHEKGLVHQDVKPANVMVTEDGIAKVTDFGLAKARAATGESPAVDSQKSILVSSGGMTPAYCSPEQANKQPLSRKTDIWSWGLSVFEMFAGEPPCKRGGQSAAEVFEFYLEQEVVEDFLPIMPKGLVQLLRQCFRRNPDDRPENFQEINEKLKGIYKEVVGHEYSRPGPKPAELLADGLNNRAISMLDLGNKEEAEKLYEQALKVDPHHPEATYNRGLLLWRSGRMTDDELVKQLEEVRTTHQDDWRDEYCLGLVHIERGDAKAAIEILEETSKRMPNVTALKNALVRASKDIKMCTHCVRVFQGHIPAGISANGRWMLSNSEEKGGKIYHLWEVATGNCVRTFNVGSAKEVISVALSSDGHLALFGSNKDSFIGPGRTSTLRLFDLTAMCCLREFDNNTSSVNFIIFSADDRWALSASLSDNALRMWDISSGQLIRTFDPRIKCYGHIHSFAISADGRYALTAHSDAVLRIWDVLSGNCIKTLAGHKDRVLCVAVSKDFRLAFSGSRDKTIKIWDLQSGYCVRTLYGHINSVESICVDKNGQWALSGSSGGKECALRLWDLPKGKCLRTFKGKLQTYAATSYMRPLFFSPDAKWSIISHTNIKLWEFGHQCNKRRFQAPPVLCRVYSLSEHLEASKSFHEEVERANTALQERRITDALTCIRRARMAPGRSRVPEALRVWIALGMLCKRSMLQGAWCVRTFQEHTGEISSAVLSTDAKLALSASFVNKGGRKSDFKIKLWEPATGYCIKTLEAPANKLALSEDGRYALLANGPRISLFDVNRGCCLKKFEGHKNTLVSIALSPDCFWVLSGGRKDATLRLWERATGHCIRTFKENSVTSVAFTPDSRVALSGSIAGTIRLWELSTGRWLRTFKQKGTVESIALSQDGHSILCGGYKGTLQLWELATGSCIMIFEGHTDTINSVALTADGGWAMSASDDGTIRIWDTSTGNCVRILKLHTQEVISLSLSEDSQLMLSGSRDGTVRLWALDWELEAPQSTGWDDSVQPFLEHFLTLHTLYGKRLPKDHKPTEEESSLALIRCGKPIWSEQDYTQLLYTLGCAGYGWVRPEIVRKKLEEMTVNWQGPPPLTSKNREGDGEHTYGYRDNQGFFSAPDIEEEIDLSF